MTMATNTSPGSPRKEPYVRPELVTIELKAEQVLAAGCKTSSQNASGNPLCGSANNCLTLGS
jgi:hypothetical protein